MPRPYHKVLFEAVERSGRSARDVSLAAVGHESAVRSLRRGLDLRLSTVEGLCRELGLELRIGPPERSPNAPAHPLAPRTVADDQALAAMLDAITRTWRAATPTQRTVLLASLTSSHRFVDDWITGRLPVVDEDMIDDERRHPPLGEPDA
ncbi:MAG: hypothetical protein OXU81_14395 [Gammaproteobacteria bacterium]|nr:hypothetical protein [Gammaproteobacteria bacterium]